MENASFAGEGRTGATSDSPARNGIRRSATPRRRTAPPLRTTGCLNEPESTLPVLAFRLSSPKSACARAHHSEFGSPDSSRVHKPIDLCGSFGRIPSTLGLLRISGRHRSDVALTEGEGKFHGGLGGPGELAVMPGLAVGPGSCKRPVLWPSLLPYFKRSRNCVALAAPQQDGIKMRQGSH